MKTNLISLLILVFVSSCAPQSIDYFTVKTSQQFKDPKITIPLQIVINREVKDSLILEENYHKTSYEVTDFRRTVGENLKQTFKKSFSTVEIIQKMPEKGLVLNIIEMNPATIVDFELSLFNKKGYNPDSQTIFLTSFSYKFNLFLDGKKIQNINQVIRTDSYLRHNPQPQILSKTEYPRTVRNISQIPDTFVFGFKLVCEEISQKVLSGNLQNQYLMGP